MFSNIRKTVGLSAFCGLLYLAIWTDAAQFGKYKVEMLTCDINFGHVIATTQAFSTVHCGVNCQSQNDCRSSVFSVSAATCYLNNKTKNSGDMVQEGCGKELKYMEKAAASESLQCERREDCVEKNVPLCENREAEDCVDCNEGSCTCLWAVDYHNIIDNTCRNNCMSFEDTFDRYNYYSMDWRDRAMRSDVSFEECKEACLGEASFMAIGFPIMQSLRCAPTPTDSTMAMLLLMTIFIFIVESVQIRRKWKLDKLTTFLT